MPELHVNHLVDKPTHSYNTESKEEQLTFDVLVEGQHESQNESSSLGSENGSNSTQQGQGSGTSVKEIQATNYIINRRRRRYSDKFLVDARVTGCLYGCKFAVAKRMWFVPFVKVQDPKK